MILPLQNPAHHLYRFKPVGAQGVQHLAPRRADPVILPGPRFPNFPFTFQKALLFQPPQQRVKRSFFDVQPLLGKLLDQAVAIASRLHLAKDSQYDNSAPQFQPEIVNLLVGFWHILYDLLLLCAAQYQYTVYHTVLSSTQYKGFGKVGSQKSKKDDVRCRGAA